MLCTDSPLAPLIGLIGFMAKKDKTEKKILCTTTKGLEASEVCARVCVCVSQDLVYHHSQQLVVLLPRSILGLAVLAVA